MASKHMKRWAISYVIRELHIKKTMRYHYTPIRMAKIWNPDIIKCWQEYGTTGTIIHCLWEQNSSTATLEDSLVVSYKAQHTLTI